MSYERSAVVGFRSVLTFPGADPTGTNDSSAAFQAAVNALAGTGVALWVPAGTYKIATTVTLPSNLKIIGSPGAVLNAAMTHTGVGSTTNCVFIASSATSALTTLASNNTVGAASFSVVSTVGMSNGQWISVLDAAGLLGAYYQITNIVGATVSVDRPIAAQFLTGASVAAATPPMDIVIEGNGMIIEGGGDRAIEISGGLRCRVSDVHVVSSGIGFDSIVMSFDIGARDSVFDHCEIDGGSVSVAGFALESSESCAIRNCRAQYCTQGIGVGFYIVDSYHAEIVGAFATANVLGIQLTTGEANTGLGCVGCKVANSTVFANTSHGVQVLGAGTGNILSGVVSESNSGSGFYLSNSAGETVSQTLLSACEALSNTGDGLTIIAGVVETVVSGFVADSNGQFGVNSGSDLTIVGFRSNSSVGGALQMSGSANLYLSDANLSMGVNGAWSAFTGSTTGKCLVSNAVISGDGGTGNHNVLDCPSAGEWQFDQVLAKGTLAFGVYMGHGVACKFKRGANVDMSVCATPYTFDASALPNFGTFTLNGVTQVVVGAAGSFPIDATIAWSLKTVGSTPGTASPYFSAATTAGTFSVKSPTANANDVYNWHAY